MHRQLVLLHMYTFTPQFRQSEGLLKSLMMHNDGRQTDRRVVLTIATVVRMRSMTPTGRSYFNITMHNGAFRRLKQAEIKHSKIENYMATTKDQQGERRVCLDNASQMCREVFACCFLQNKSVVGKSIVFQTMLAIEHWVDAIMQLCQ